MKKIKISIIVPVWNVEKYINKCLDSLVHQTLDEIEIIVVNDGSPDNSQTIIDKYVKKYPGKVKSFIKENGGQGSARNYGLSKARGEYVGYVDSDDYVEIDMYKKMYDKAKKSDLDIVICGSNNIVNNEKIIDLDKNYFSNNNKLNSYFGRMAVWNKIFRRNLLINNDIQFRNKVWYEDVDFTIKAISAANKIGYVNEPLYNYLIREGSTMNNSNVDRNTEILLSFNELLKDNNVQKNKEIIEYLAIDNIYISAIVRVILSNTSFDKKKMVINVLKEYMNENFKEYKNNKYIYLLSRNRKIIYKLINGNHYKLIQVIFKIKKRCCKC